MMLWKKPPELRYTQLCMYIDEHAPELLEADSSSEVANLIYNYLYLLVKALAIKKRMFTNFNDYDGYAIHSANRLFFSLKKSYLNAGQVIKGKTIAPIKSILNYTKALMFPMKMEYLAEQQKLESSAEKANKQFRAFETRQRLRNSAWYQQGSSVEYAELIKDLFNSFKYLLDDVLNRSPFSKDSPEYKRLRMSILLNCKLNLKNHKGINADPVTVVVWKLPKSMGNYVRLFIKELGTKLKEEIVVSYNESVIDDHILDYLISNPDGEFINHEE